jgi:hypothetical protein
LGSSGGSIIIQPVGSQTAPTIISKAFTAFRQLFFTAADVKDSEQLYRVLYTMQQNSALTLRILAQSPVGGGNLLVGVVFGSGQTLYLQHGLQTPYTGWWCTRAQGANVASLVEAAFPPSTTPDQILPITSNNAGQFDIYVF